MTISRTLTLTIVAIVLLAIFHARRHANEIRKLDAMIQANNVVGFSKLIAWKPNLVNVYIESRTRLSLLDHAASFGREEICSNLIAAGADVNSQDTGGETPLFHAFGASNTNIITMLLQHGANVSHTNMYGDTPLFCAIIERNTNAVIMMLKYGADPNHTNAFGRSAIDFAQNTHDLPLINIVSNAISKPMCQIEEKVYDNGWAELGLITVYRNGSYSNYMSGVSTISSSPIASTGQLPKEVFEPLAISVRTSHRWKLIEGIPTVEFYVDDTMSRAVPGVYLLIDYLRTGKVITTNEISKYPKGIQNLYFPPSRQDSNSPASP